MVFQNITAPCELVHKVPQEEKTSTNVQDSRKQADDYREWLNGMCVAEKDK